MARYLVALALAAVLSLAVAGPARAADCPCACPEPGPEFGAHIADMAPEHARGGSQFGRMVSHMATP